MKRMLTILLLGCAIQVQADVYKWVDEDGNVHFSDEPRHPNAEKIHVPPPSTYTPAPLPQAQPSAPQQPPELDQGYTRLAITSPGNDAVIWDTSGEVMVSVALEPALRVDLGHKLEFSLDGRQVGESSSDSYLITNVERGTHNITARVVNAAGTALDSDTVTIHLRQRTVWDTQQDSGDEPGDSPSGDPRSDTLTVPRAPQMPKAPQAPKLPPRVPSQ